MKKTLMISALVLVMSAAAWAHMGGPGMMGEPGEQTQQWGWEPGMMMGPGMMGGCSGYGMGPGMMGNMMGMMGMGPGMMGGYGMGPGMSPGMMNPYDPQMRKFLDETRDLRRQIHMKQFDYMEAIRNPETKPETIEKLQKEIRDLTIKLYEKMPLYQ